jgi:ADP-ribose pyrophosphatase YjhB (NUDIX family)
VFHRIRVSVIVPDRERVLLVKAYAPESRPSVGGMTGEYWELPGGGLEGDEPALTGAVREAREETGLKIVPERIVYVHEVINRWTGSVERPIRQIELYVLARSYSGELRLTDHDILDARFFAEDEIEVARCYPPMLADVFWADLRLGFPDVRVFGPHIVEQRP